MGRGPDVRLLASVVAAVIFGASAAYAAIGAALASYSPAPLLALLRMCVGGLGVVGTLYAAFSGMALPEVSDLPTLAFAGLFALYNVALNYGQLSASAGAASLIIASIPIFTAVLAVVFLGERLDVLGWLGIAVGFLGMALITLGEEEEEEEEEEEASGVQGRHPGVSLPPGSHSHRLPVAGRGAPRLIRGRREGGSLRRGAGEPSQGLTPELPRTSLPRRQVNKGKKGRGAGIKARPHARYQGLKLQNSLS